MAYVVRGSGAPSLTFARSGGDVAIGRISCYRGIDPNNPHDTGSANTLGANSTTVTTTSLTTAVGDELLVMACCFADNTSASAQLAGTNPTQFYWHERADSNTATGADTGLAVADTTKLSAGSTGTLQYSAGNSSRHVCIVGAFRPARMNVNRSLLDTQTQGNGSFSSIVTDSFTPPNNCLLVAVLWAGATGAEASYSSLSGGSLTWTRRVQQLASSGSDHAAIEMWTAPVTTAASMTLTCTTTNTSYANQVAVYAVMGYSVNDPIGASGTLSSFAADTTPIVLSAAPAVGSITFAGRGHIPPGSGVVHATPSVGWTESADLDNLDGWGTMAVQERWNSTDANCAWMDANDEDTSPLTMIGAALEIKGAPSLLFNPTPMQPFLMR